MKKIIPITSITWLFLVLAVSSSCMKKPDSKVNYGPEVTAEDIELSLNDLKIASITEIRKGEFAYIDYSVQQDDRQPETLSQTGITVTDRREDSNYIYLDVVNELKELVDGIWKDSKSQTTYTIKLQQSLQANALATRKTFHNFTRNDGLYSTPVAVLKRPDCGGLRQCTPQVRASVISWDEVVWESEERGTKTRKLFVISPDVPYLAAELKVCQTLWMDFEQDGQTMVVPITACNEVKDFTFGTE